MTYQTDCTLPDSLLEQIAEQGLGILPELARIVVNTAMQAEREAYLGAAAYERTGSRRGNANSLRPRGNDHQTKRSRRLAKEGTTDFTDSTDFLAAP